MAIGVVDKMLECLPKESPVFKHIADVSSKATIQVTAKVDGQRLIPFKLVEFPYGNIPVNQIPSEAGVYAFTKKANLSQQAFGSAIDFRRRVNDHKNQFIGLAQPTALHKSGRMEEFC